MRRQPAIFMVNYADRVSVGPTSPTEIVLGDFEPEEMKRSLVPYVAGHGARSGAVWRDNIQMHCTS
ncbi:MAG TPA: hypothetical protein VLA83_18170 [Candidatus Binatia bacterium]|nr:hypothetical protein [Candidatus Binatia bacterium]